VGLVGIYRGRQDETVYRRLDDGSDAAHARLEVAKRQQFGRGEFYALLPPTDAFTTSGRLRHTVDSIPSARQRHCLRVAAPLRSRRPALFTPVSIGIRECACPPMRVSSLPVLVTSGPSTLIKDQIAERGARMARRDDREYREYLREEQRSNRDPRPRGWSCSAWTGNYLLGTGARRLRSNTASNWQQQPASTHAPRLRVLIDVDNTLLDNDAVMRICGSIWST